MSSQPSVPPSLVVTPDSDESTDTCGKSWVERILDLVGDFAALVVIAGAGFMFLQIFAIPIPDVSSDADQLDRIEMQAARASAFAQRDHYALFTLLYLGAAIGIVLIDMRRKEQDKQLEDLNRRIVALQAEIETIQDEYLDDEERELDESRAEREAIMARIVGAAFSSNRFGQRPPGDEEDDVDDMPTFGRPRRPTNLN